MHSTVNRVQSCERCENENLHYIRKVYFEDYLVGKSCLFSKLSYTLRDLTYTNVTVLLALYILFPEYHNPFRDHLADTGRKHRKGMDLMSSVRKGIPIKCRIILFLDSGKKCEYVIFLRF